MIARIILLVPLDYGMVNQECLIINCENISRGTEERALVRIVKKASQEDTAVLGISKT